MNLPFYTTLETTEVDRTLYFFESNGSKSIIKAIEYFPIMEMNDRVVFNLGFGDYVDGLGTIVDNVNSNNGDVYIVFNTVLSTVPMFFDKYPEAVLIVSGSDNHDEFVNNCLPVCTKKCKGDCKNYQRRIKLYRAFVNKHFKELCKEYVFFGRYKSDPGTTFQYIPNEQYDDILVYKKK